MYAHMSHFGNNNSGGQNEPVTGSLIYADGFIWCHLKHNQHTQRLIKDC
jgi:hypothetical protein